MTPELGPLPPARMHVDDYPPSHWKIGNEWKPFHPSASHVDPQYRDGWNRAYYAAQEVARKASSGEDAAIVLPVLSLDDALHFGATSTKRLNELRTEAVIADRARGAGGDRDA